MLNALEMKICKALAERGPRVIGNSEKSKAMFSALSERGYVTLGKGRCGPIGIYTGETVASLSDAGRDALQAVIH